MADICTACPGRPYKNICSCPPRFGISVMQPSCHRLATPCNGLNLVNNPCYCPETNKSTWTYKFFTDCTPGTNINPIGLILIPICVNISRADVTVEEKIDGFGEFTTVPFFLDIHDSSFGDAPRGFQWLKIENNNRYDNGVAVEYRLTLTGDYPVSAQPIRVKAGINELIFQCGEGCFQVPGCPEPGRLDVKKNSDMKIDNNVITLSYSVRVRNSGGSPLRNTMFEDIITLDGIHAALGDINVEPSPPLEFKIISPNMIRVSGDIGTLIPEQEFAAKYSIKISSIDQAGVYIVTNRANATSGNINGEDMDTRRIEVARVRGEKFCSMTNGNEVEFRIRVAAVCASPQTRVNFTDRIQVPAGVTVEFISFDDCMASVGTGVPVTNQNVLLTCNGIVVPAGGFVEKVIKLKVTEVRAFQIPAQITNTLTQITYSNTNPQVILPAQNIPVSASAEVVSDVKCKNPS